MRTTRSLEEQLHMSASSSSTKTSSAQPMRCHHTVQIHRRSWRMRTTPSSARRRTPLTQSWNTSSLVMISRTVSLPGVRSVSTRLNRIPFRTQQHSQRTVVLRMRTVVWAADQEAAVHLVVAARLPVQAELVTLRQAVPRQVVAAHQPAHPLPPHAGVSI